MDAPLASRGAGRPIKRGRGAAAVGSSIRGRSSSNLSASFNNSAGASASTSSTPSFKRKLAGTPLFQPLSDGESGEDALLPSMSTTKRSRNVAAATSMMRSDSKDGGDSDAEQAARKSRFEVTASENRYLQLKPLRERERKEAIAAGLIPDPLKPRRLDEALSFEGTCEDMCPEFEREEREFQKNVDRWEMNPGSNRIVREKAVKAFHRPAAGNEQPMPSDVRPPHVLKRVLDYLFHDILSQDPEMTESHPFLRDRTRAVRQDFTMQHERGPMAIECHERIARYHILCLHVLREWENFSESQELEQLRKVLQSLNEFYDDARIEGLECPHEAEFRAYYLITHLRDSDTIRQTECLPYDLFNSQHIQAALRLQSLALRNNESRGERGRRPANSEASLNAFSRFFKHVARDETSYLLACLAESHFTDIRRGALVAMRKAYIPQNPQYPVGKLAKMLGCNDVQHCAEIAENFGLNVTRGVGGLPVSVELHKQVALQEYPSVIKQRTSRAIVEVKRGRATIQSIIDGKFHSSHVDPALTTKHISKDILPARRVKALSPTVKKSASFITPPISAPATPQPQSSPSSASAFTFKPPLASSSKLNAVAPAFQPSTPAGKPPVSAFGAFGQASAFAVPAQPAQQPPSRKEVPTAVARPPLQPVQPAPATQPQHARKPSKQAVSPVTAFQSASTPRKVSPKSLQPSTASTNRLLNKALPQLLDLLLSDHIERHSRNAAMAGLSVVHAQETAVLVAERQTVIEQCASELLDKALDDFASEKADYIIAELYERKNALRRDMKSWRRALVRAKEVRAARQQRNSRFKDLATHLESSTAKGQGRAEFQEETLLDLSMLDLGSGLADSAYAPLPVASTSKTAFWQAGTLSRYISSTVNATLGALAPVEIPDWKCIVVVPSLEDPLATWYRCKLNMGSDDEGSVVMMENVRVEFALLAKAELEQQDLHDVALVIANTVEAVGSSTETLSLPQRLVKESIYKARLLQADWSDSESSTPGFDKRHTIDVAQVNGGLEQVLNDLLVSIAPNNAGPTEVSPRDLVVPLIAIWKAGLQQAFAGAAIRANEAHWQNLIRRFVSLLQDLCDRLDSSLSLDQDDRHSGISMLSSHPAKDSVLELLQDYLGQVKPESSIPLAFLASRLETVTTEEQQVTTFFDALVADLLECYDAGRVDALPDEEEMQGLRADCRQAVADAMTALARVPSKEAGKKRRRPASA